MTASIQKRILVDMSATLIHHGHIRLLKYAASYGGVIVALTTDDEILKKKGYRPELSFLQRKEIIESFIMVTEVIPSPWLITEEFLDLHLIDLLVHGEDNSNQISSDKLVVVPRTKDISSSILREKSCRILQEIDLFNKEV